jgi:hypothetical protein
MNGSMDVNSTPDVGSLFWFTAIFQHRHEDNGSRVIDLGALSRPSVVMLIANNNTLRNSVLRTMECIGRPEKSHIMLQ